MNKRAFLVSLRYRLTGLPQEEMEERVRFYCEMIEDRMEDGLSEEDAVAAIGSVDEIALQIVADVPFATIAKGTIKPRRRLQAWEIVLLVLGSPVWLSLLIAAVAVAFSLYVSLWSVIVSLWAVFASLVGGAFGGIVGGTVLALRGNYLTGLALIGGGVVCAGLAIFAFCGCKAATVGVVRLTKKAALSVKHRLLKRGEHDA